MSTWRDILPVHPAADLFPMMTPDEITALGEDIKNNGLKQPIVHLSDRLADNLADILAERGITPTPLSVIAMRSTLASTRPPPSRAEMIRQQECPPRAQGQPGSKPWQ